MSDVVVTVPKNFTHPDCPGLKGLAAWVGEGDAAGAEWSGQEWEFFLGGSKPVIGSGERVYVVCEGKLRGYAPLIRVEDYGYGSWALIRGGGAIAVTVDEPITGFRGFRYRWWDRSAERPFPDWQKST